MIKANIGITVTYETKTESGYLDVYSTPSMEKSGDYILFDLEFDCEIANLLSKKSGEGEVITLSFNYPNGNHRVISCSVDSICPGSTDSKFLVTFIAERAQL